jgi:hypothetical protein
MNGQGRLAQRLEGNANASLFFAVTDLEYPPADQRRFGSTRELKREATKLSYRAHGTATWVPLFPVYQGSDPGSVDTLHRFPAGDMYRAELYAVTRAGTDAIDLRIEIEDLAGNRTTWTQSPAILITGNTTPPPLPGRRRAAPH